MQRSIMLGRTALLGSGLVIGIVMALVATLLVAPPGAAAGDPTDEDSDGINIVEPGDHPDFELEYDDGLFKNKFINGTAFAPDRNSVSYQYRLGGCVQADGSMRTNLELPHGAQIIAIEYLWRQESDATTTLQLWTHGNGPVDGSSPGADNVFSVTSEAEASWGSTYDAPDESIVIDNTTTTYHLRYMGNDNSSDELLCGVRIQYTLASDSGKVFTPIDACAIFDTRESQGGQGKPAAGDTLVIDTVAGDFSYQGGAESDCDIPAASILGRNMNTALLVNLVALSPEGSGNLRAWDAGTAPPGGVLVYGEGMNNANAVVIPNRRPSLFGPGNEFRVQVNGPATHVRAVVLGYYSDPPQNQN